MAIVMMASMLGLAASAMAGGNEMAALVAVLLGALSLLLDFIGMFRGNYYLAVELVNSTGAEGWAYSDGVAVMALPSGVIAILDTRSRELYLAREYSLQRYPLLSGKSVKFRAVIFASRTIELRGPEGLKAEIVRGFLEGPSIGSERGSVRVSGTFLKAKLKFKDVKAQAKGLLEALKEV
jgi:hypothetical protein